MAEYLSDEELVERIKRWWSENGTALVVGIVLAVGGVMGWRWFDGWRSERAEAASETYAEYLDARTAGEDATALAARIEDEFPNSAYRVFTLFHEARDAIEGEEWEPAAELLRQALDVAPEAALRDIARLRLARVLHQIDRPDEALAALAEVDGRGFASAVAELTGDIEQRRGALGAAREAYRAALEAAPSEQGTALLRLKLATLPPEAAADGVEEAIEEVLGEAGEGVEEAAPDDPAELPPEAEPEPEPESEDGAEIQEVQE